MKLKVPPLPYNCAIEEEERYLQHCNSIALIIAHNAFEGNIMNLCINKYLEAVGIEEKS